MTERDVEVGPGESVILASLYCADITGQSLHVPLYDEVFVAKWCKVYETSYCKKVIVLVGKSEYGDPVFGTVRDVLSVNSNAVLVYKLWHTVGFKRHFHAYIAHPCQPSEVAVAEIAPLLDFMP